MAELPNFDERIDAFWRRFTEHRRALGDAQRIRALTPEPGHSPRVPGEGDGDQPIPGLPSGFLPYQLNFNRDTVNGGGRGGPAAEQGPKGSILPPTSDRAE